MVGKRPFTDRTDAGQQLAAAVQRRVSDVDIVLTIPRGGLPLGRVVADVLEVPLDVIVAKKIGAPNNPEYAIGAVTADGSVWRNEAAVVGGGDVDAYFERMREEEAANARQKARRYRGERPEPALSGKTVVLVDDGVATGSTIRACIQQLHNAKAHRVILAVPVGPPDTIAELESVTDDIICLHTPSNFRAVGQYYDEFDQVSDEKAIYYLGF